MALLRSSDFLSKCFPGKSLGNNSYYSINHQLISIIDIFKVIDLWQAIALPGSGA